MKERQLHTIDKKIFEKNSLYMPPPQFIKKIWMWLNKQLKAKEIKHGKRKLPKKWTNFNNQISLCA